MADDVRAGVFDVTVNVRAGYRLVALDSARLTDVLKHTARWHEEFEHVGFADGLSNARAQILQNDRVVELLGYYNAGCPLNVTNDDRTACLTTVPGSVDINGMYGSERVLWVGEGTHRTLLMWATRPAVLFHVPEQDCQLLIEAFGWTATLEDAGYRLDDKARSIFVASSEEASRLPTPQYEGTIVDHYPAPKPDPLEVWILAQAERCRTAVRGLFRR